MAVELDSAGGLILFALSGLVQPNSTHADAQMAGPAAQRRVLTSGTASARQNGAYRAAVGKRWSSRDASSKACLAVEGSFIPFQGRAFILTINTRTKR